MQTWPARCLGLSPHSLHLGSRERPDMSACRPEGRSLWSWNHFFYLKHWRHAIMCNKYIATDQLVYRITRNDLMPEELVYYAKKNNLLLVTWGTFVYQANHLSHISYQIHSPYLTEWRCCNTAGDQLGDVWLYECFPACMGVSAHALQPVSIYMCTLEETGPPGIWYTILPRKKVQVTHQITSPLESGAGCLVKAICIMHAISL